jgi:uncharacterized membrane protein
MDRMLVVVFENEDKAREASGVLRGLDREGFIAVYDAAVVTKNHNGKTVAKKAGDFGPMGTLAGAAVGGLIGLLAGPIGATVGAVGGTLMGALSDLENVRVGTDFLADVAADLTPGKAALVAEVEEDETEPVDASMEALGGNVLRRSLRNLKNAANEQDLATTKAEIVQLKAEHAEARADRKAKLQARIDALNAKLRKKIDEAKAKREAIRSQARAKLETLKAKAAQARGSLRERHEKRLAAVEKEYDNAVERLEEARASEETVLL